MGQSRPLCSLFSSFRHTNFKYNFNNKNWNKRSVDCVLGIQTGGCMMVGEDETM